ncbi:MAG: TonB-dependent receptor [Gemmatimonadaceae bacterium]
MSRGGARGITHGWRASLIAALVTLTSESAAAQTAASCAGSALDANSAPRWTAPLDRTVSLHARDISLREALDRVAVAARIRLSYVAEFLPLDKSVCAAYRDTPAGSALSALLRGTGVERVVIGTEQVVLAPTRKIGRPDSSGSTSRAPAMLDRVVVTGSATEASARGLPIALEVLGGRRIGEHATTSISESLNGAVPGLWVWEQSPTSLVTRYGSVRGASSFGLTYPKVYVDGIQVANPLLLTQLTPESVERVEIIRGPQGAALYGADAISGVVNIVTRHDGTDSGSPEVTLRSGLGLSGSSFVGRPALMQDHAFVARTGTDLQAADLSVTVGTLGAVTPGSYSREINAIGGLRFVWPSLSVSGTARFLRHAASEGTSPLLQQALPPRSDSMPRGLSLDGPALQSVTQYTVGGRATFTPDERWTHSVLVGVDGYRLSDVTLDGTPIPSAVDSALRAARGGADRVSVRASSVYQMPRSAAVATTLTFAAEHSILRDESTVDVPQAPGNTGRGFVSGVADVAFLSNSGIVAQVNSAIYDRLYLTGGLRVERNDGFSNAMRVATLPMLGASFVHDEGAVTVKFRAAFGKGIRPARTPTRNIAWYGVGHSRISADLAPEEQTGIEEGVDLFLGRAVALHLTRFDQLASGLIQQVPVTTDYPDNGGGMQPQLSYALQNVGEITNRGWEAEGAVSTGALSLGATLSLVDSRVRRLANGYTGDLTPGARVLDVPATTIGANATWRVPGWSATLGLSRASDWVGYDRIALADAFSRANGSLQGFVGPQLRGYWHSYDGATHLRASGSREVRPGVFFTVIGDNLLDAQRGEPDNLTIVPGRTVTAGVRLSF